MTTTSVWLVVFFVAQLLSCGSCWSVVFKLQCGRMDPNVQSTSVYWILLFFFGYLGASCGFDALFTLQLLVDDDLQDQYADVVLDVPSDDEQVPVVTRWRLILVQLLSDLTSIAFSCWFVAMGHELAVLADKTMDRGAQRELAITKRYVVWIHVVVVVFAGCEIVIIARQQEYRGAALVTLVTLVVLFFGMIYVAVRMCMLRCKGRHLVTVDGQIVASPLYVRIRNLMAVFAVLSLQSVLGPISSLEWVYLLTSTLQHLAGLILALLVGCSQEWIVEIFGKYLPEEYVSQVMTPTLIAYIEKLDAPKHNPVFVFTDIESSSALWALENGEIMRPANELHDDILRSLLLKYNGYEITTAGDAFQLAFHRIEHAVKYCVEAQFQLLHAKWPKKLRKCGVVGVASERVNGKTILDGLRVRMGIHDAQDHLEGPLVSSVHPVTGKTTYTGLSQAIAEKVGDLGHGGQIVVTSRVAEWVEANRTCLGVPCHPEYMRSYVLTSLNERIELFQLVVKDLEPRVAVFRRAPPRKLASCCEIESGDENQAVDAVRFDPIIPSVSWYMYPDQPQRPSSCCSLP